MAFDDPHLSLEMHMVSYYDLRFRREMRVASDDPCLALETQIISYYSLLALEVQVVSDYSHLVFEMRMAFRRSAFCL